jgi:hypothetical protein
MQGEGVVVKLLSFMDMKASFGRVNLIEAFESFGDSRKSCKFS